VLLNYQSLRVLDLSFNQLRLLPVTICELSRLTGVRTYMLTYMLTYADVC
jgi:hypothetical protein